MTPDDPRKPPSPHSKEERLAKALRDNLARRKALVRAKREKTAADAASPGASPDPGRAIQPDGDDGDTPS